ncbi:6833_t:CDS:2, partial [Cetraspora pellucida]
MARTKKPIAEETNEIKRTNNIERKDVEEEDMGARMKEKTVAEETIVEEAVVEEAVAEKTIAEETIMEETLEERQVAKEVNMLNDLGSNYEKEMVSDIVSKTASHSSRNLESKALGRFTTPIMSSMEDSEYFNILTMEPPINTLSRNKSSHQLQSRVTISDLLRMSDSDNSNGNI